MEEPPRPPLRILVVDDSPEDRLIYRRLLAKDPDHRYELIETDSGAEGLRRALAERPDCVLLDYRLPDLDGLEFLDALTAAAAAAAGVADAAPAARADAAHAGDAPGAAAVGASKAAAGTSDAAAPGQPPLPVIVLTGQGNEVVAVEAMKRGAQDYLVKDAISPQGLRRAVHNAMEKVRLRGEVEERTAQLESANAELRREVAERERAELALQDAHAGLESLVAKRTEELSLANAGLKREVAERRRAEEERAALLVREREARRQAEEASRLKDEFLATVSHELRTPLNAILGWAHLLRTGKLDPASAESALERIERNAKAQAQLIGDLLDVSRIITGNLRIEMRPVELARVVEAALDSVALAAQAKGITIAVHLEAAPAVLGDSTRLQQVVWNLLANAIKFTPREGMVEIRVLPRREEARIEVRDTGAGIAAEFLPYVFDRFRQADSTPARTHGGLGLGLAIVRHLVEQHGGTVEVASAGEGQGAVFSVVLPALAKPLESGDLWAAQEAAGIAGAAPSGAVLAGLAVLVVEDEADTRELIVHALAGAGARVAAVASVGEALAQLDLQLPDVMVSDIGMPGDDGYALIHQLRSRGRLQGAELPAAALTAYAGPQDRARALAAGFQTFLAKPLDVAELVGAVAELGGRPQPR